MRFILCLTSYLLLDWWTDLHETLGVYTTRPGLLHGVLFHFRSEPPNRKLGGFENRKSEPEIENILYEKRIKFYVRNTILLFWYFGEVPTRRTKTCAKYIIKCGTLIILTHLAPSSYEFEFTHAARLMQNCQCIEGAKWVNIIRAPHLTPFTSKSFLRTLFVV